MRTALCLTASLLMGGCAGPRPLAPPEAILTAPGQWRNPWPASAADAKWWTRFKDPALNALVEAAMTHNPDLGIAAARVAEARALLAQAEGLRQPYLSFGLGAERSRSLNAFGREVEQTAGKGGLEASYEVDLFDRLRYASDAARAQITVQTESQQQIRLGVIASVTAGYLNLRGLDARLELVKQTVVARQDALRLATRRSERGYSPAFEAQQAQAELKAATQLVPQMELAIARQEHALSLLTGLGPDDIRRGLTFDELPQPEVPGVLPAELLRRRPDVLAAEAQVVAADAALDASRAAFMPTIRLSASGYLAGSTLLDDNADLFNVGASLLAPIFSGGRLRAQADASAARRDQAAFIYRRVALGAFREVEDGLIAVKKTREQWAEQQAQADAARSVYRMAKNRYEAGYAPYLEQVDAQRTLLAAELAVVQVRADHNAALVQLYLASGGGWGA